MDRRKVTTGLLLAGASFALAPLRLRAQHVHDPADARASVTVSFGAGLNTAQPGNAANHHVLPDEINVSVNGAVNFVVGGFHWIFIYRPGVTVENIVVPPSGLFVNFDVANLFYRGIEPAGGPLATPATISPSNALNRVESVSFPEVGDYLVICNVRPHFLDGMHATIRVR
jgi:hypothetical protein